MDTQQPPVLLTDKSLLIQQQQQAKVEEHGQKSNLRHQLDDLLFGSVMIRNDSTLTCRNPFIKQIRFFLSLVCWYGR